MPLSMIYWVLVLLWAVLGGVSGYRDSAGKWGWTGGWLLTLIIYIVIGLIIAGSPIKGG